MMDATDVADRLTAECQTIAARVRAFRIRRGWDVSQLAMYANVSRTTLYNLERGNTLLPRGSTLHRIANAFGVTVDHLRNEISSENFRVMNSETADHLLQQAVFDRWTNPMIDEVRLASPQLFGGWKDDDWDELYSTFGTGGALNRDGVVDAVQKMNRKRETVRQLQVLLETHMGDVAIRMLETLYQMIHPESNLVPTPDLAELLDLHAMEQTLSHPESEVKPD